jgi:RNA polymerase sigma-70 factor (ECF subfamily)
MVATSDIPALVERLSSGDRTALGEIDALFASHQDVVYATCLRAVGRPERARELAQDAMLIAYRKLPSFRGEASFGTWLYAIARNLCRRHHSKRKDVLVEDGVLDSEDPASGVMASLRRHEREELMRAASVAVLTEQEQEAVHLRYVEGMSQQRITEVLGIDAKTGARGLLQRCRRKLERELRRRLEEMGHGSSFVRTMP